MSYDRFLKEIEMGNIRNMEIPHFAFDYWQLPRDARLKELVQAIRADEAGHRDVNHQLASACVELKSAATATIALQ